MALSQRSTTNSSLVMSLYRAHQDRDVISGRVDNFTKAASTDLVTDDANVHYERGQFE